MSSDRKNESNVRMELKYCEHCGGLWVRESGAGVYCAKCEAKISELPIPKKRQGRVMLPKLGKSVAEDYGRTIPEEAQDLETAAGGVA